MSIFDNLYTKPQFSLGSNLNAFPDTSSTIASSTPAEHPLVTFARSLLQPQAGAKTSGNSLMDLLRALRNDPQGDRNKESGPGGALSPFTTGFFNNSTSNLPVDPAAQHATMMAMRAAGIPYGGNGVGRFMGPNERAATPDTTYNPAAFVRRPLVSNGAIVGYPNPDPTKLPFTKPNSY